MRLDYNYDYPSGMSEYLEIYGWHFSKKMCEWAVSKMYKKVNGKKVYIVPITKDSFEDLSKRHNIIIRDSKGYDDVYLANMCKADFFGSSIKTDVDLVRFVKDVIDDEDGYEGLPFTRFYADCIGSGTPIIWDEMI